MQRYLRLILILLSILSYDIAKSQTAISIPAFTAYAVPVEKSNEDDESTMFSAKNGIQNWTGGEQKIHFFFKVRSIGRLEMFLRLKSNISSSVMIASIANSRFKITVPKSGEFKLVKIGSIEIKDTGFYSLTLFRDSSFPLVKHVDKKDPLLSQIPVIADIRSLELSGNAAKDVHFNAKPRRNAASVHLLYPLHDSVKVLSFYNEITIPKDADILHSYYMACGFTRGYFGIQVNSPTERRVIFSVWDAGNEAIDRNKVSEDNKVQLIAKGEDVFADGFGNEGTGGHSHWVFNWKTGETYKFLVTATIDSAAATTTYTGYFFIPEIQKWKLIAAFKAPKDGKPLRRLYSFVENFWGVNGQMYRKAYFGDQWIRKENGQWVELATSTFSYDATGKAGDRIDYGAGVENNKFYLWNGGFRSANAKFNDTLSRILTGERPIIDLYKNADSLKEITKENESILTAIKEGKFDTTGSAGGIYYKILREGTGDPVTINDTVVINYKGSLLNGFVFDQTKNEPATFPLKRLIKGWQMGLPFCKQGGKIRLIIPSALGYSIRNLGVIPPNSVLIFDIEVLEIKKQH